MTRILLIEDQAPMRRNLSLMLKMEGFEVLAAENGRAGLELAQREKPDLILCDVMMPELGGHDVLEKLRADPATGTIPFIFLTARGDKPDIHHGMNLGADDYLTKPAQRAEVLAAIALLSASAFAGDLVNVSGASKVAVSGYDTVAFFIDSKPVNGSPFIADDYQGATYYFATEEHKKLFTENPAKYAPQFGGFCAYGVALGKLFPVDINTWQVRDAKLYLNLNPATS